MSCIENQDKYVSNIIGLLEKFGMLSIHDLIDNYKKEYNEQIPYPRHDPLHKWLISIDNVKHDLRNCERFYRLINKRKISPLKSSKETPSKRSRSLPDVNNNDKKENNDDVKNLNTPRQSREVKFQEKNERQKEIKEWKTRSKSENRKPTIGTPNIYGVTLIGDNYVLGVAMYQLNYKAVKNNFGWYESGFCVSGQTIAGTAKRIKANVDKNRPQRALIYVGSMDIINGRELIEMITEFNILIKTCLEMNVGPILCTLAPIPSHQLNNRKETLKGFNEFLCINNYGLPIIDIYKGFVDKEDKHLAHYYSANPRTFNRNKTEICLWSSEGRDRFYDIVKKNIGLALLCTESKVLSFT